MSKKSLVFSKRIIFWPQESLEATLVSSCRAAVLSIAHEPTLLSLVNSRCLVPLLLGDVKTYNGEDHMEKIEDIRPTAELSPEMVKTICDAITQEFYSWELKEDDDGNEKILQ